MLKDCKSLSGLLKAAGKKRGGGRTRFNMRIQYARKKQTTGNLMEQVRINIPRDVCNKLSLKNGDTLDVSWSGNRVTVYLSLETGWSIARKDEAASAILRFRYIKGSPFSFPKEEHGEWYEVGYNQISVNKEDCSFSFDMPSELRADS